MEQKDIQAISDILSENSVVLGGNWMVTGKDSIVTKWININVPAVANLQTRKITEGATSDMAFHTGTYTLDVVRNDSVVGSEKGNFPFVWTKPAGQSWKLQLMHLEGIPD